jgi:hypothetical protein
MELLMKKMYFVLFFICYIAILCGQSESGYLLSWGDNNFNQTNVPIDNVYTEIAAGWNHTLALNADSSLIAWGDNTFGQCNVPTGYDFTAIAAGQLHSLALRSNGSLVAWGDNSFGQCNVSTEYNFISIAAGALHSLAIKADGSMVAWGNNGWGQCDVPENTNFTVSTAGRSFSLALRSDSTLIAWGYNADGQCNVPEGKFIAIASGKYHSLALRADGSLVAWGWNANGQCDIPVGNFISIAAGGYHSLAKKSDGCLVAWGDNTYGQCNVQYRDDYISISAGHYFSTAIVRNNPYIPKIQNITSLTMQLGNIVVMEESNWNMIRFKNTGFANLSISNLHFRNSSSQFIYNYPNMGHPISPDEIDTIFVKFAPTITGSISDTLFIESNAVNTPIMKIKLTGTSLSVPPSVPQELTISTQGINNNDVLIQWEPVTTTTHGGHITTDWYFVYLSNNMNGPYSFLGYTNATQYVHQGVGFGAEHMFYRVKAIKFYTRGDLLLQKLVPGMSETEVSDIIKN